MKKTFVSLMLVLVLVISLLPAGALAAGRVITLRVDPAKPGNSSSNTYFFYTIDNGTESTTSITLQTLFLNSESRLDNKGTLLKSGDTIKLPAGNLYLGNGIVDVYGDITIEGAGEDETVLYITTQSDRMFRLYNRYPYNIENGIIYDYSIKNLTMDGTYGTAKGKAFVITCYNIALNLENVTIQNFKGHAFSAWANDTLKYSGYTGSYTNQYPTKAENVGIEINLSNVETKNNGYTAHFDPSPYKNETADKYGFIHLKYDKNTTFSDNSSDYSYNGLTYSFNTNVLAGQDNVIINNAFVSYGDITPISIPTAPSSSSLPQTGDNSTPMLWLALVVLSASAVLMMRRKAFNR